jgi:hypothetical protein
MTHRAALASAVLGVVLLSAPALANDEPDELLPGESATVKPLKQVRFLAVEGDPYDLPDLANDPTVEGGSVRFFDTGAGGDDETYPLPAADWVALGGGDFVYNNINGPTLEHPCTHVEVRQNQISVQCNGAGVTLTPPFAGDLGVILTIGTSSKVYCASMGGVTDVNRTAKLERHGSPAPGACPTPPAPAPELLPGNLVIVKPLSLAKFVVKPASGSAFDMPPFPVNPTIQGATLRFRDTGATGGDVTFSLPGGPKWTVLSSGFKYRGTGDPGDPCRVVLMKPRVMKAVCVGSDVALDTGPEFTGDVAIRLTTGTGPSKRYCAQFGGTESSNSDTVLKRKSAPAPAEVDCPSPSGAFLDDTAGLWP